MTCTLRTSWLSFGLLMTTTVALYGLEPAADGRLAPEGGCTTTATVLCLLGDRFTVEIAWEDPAMNTGVGQVGSQLFDDTGYFWFTDADKPEVFVRVLDGTAFNNFFWVFSGGLSDWGYTLTVSDTETGEQAIYSNVLGSFSLITDTAAIPGPSPALTASGVALDATAPSLSSLAAGPGACMPGSTTLCLDQQRFSVEVEWEDNVGATGVAQTMPVTDLAGYFTFFNLDNVEQMVKIFDGGDGNFWFYTCATTNVAYTVTVTDICTSPKTSAYRRVGRL